MKVRITSKSGSKLSSSKAKEMLRDGTAQGHPLTSKQKKYFGWVAGGGKAKAGASISMLDHDTVEFNGPSHERGGIDIGYGGKKVEVEGEETGYFGDDGSLNIMGNMINPLSGKKFKNDSKTISDKIVKTAKAIDLGSKLLNESSPTGGKLSMLKFNSGKAMMGGGTSKMRELEQSKEHLATIQNAMLDTAHELGADPQEFSKGKLVKAKYGYKAAGSGDEIPFSKLKKTHPSYSGPLFDFNNADENELRSPYTKPVSVMGIRNSPRKMADTSFDPVMDKTPTPLINSNGLVQSDMSRNPSLQIDSEQNNDFQFENPNMPSNAKGLSFSQILPELYTAATNKQESVFLQQYNPQLYSPYNVSFQDRRNQNNSTFRAISQRYADNPQALATLAAQKYDADNQVNADEFRTNQEISSDITNKNIALMNDATAKNLSLADTQYTRQAQAKSNTKQINQGVLKSISDKIHENELEQRTLKTYENLYDYRMNPQGRMQYYGVPGKDLLEWPQSGDQSLSSSADDESTISTRTDSKGRTSTTKTKAPASLTESRQLGNIQKEWNSFTNKYNFMRKRR